MQETTDNPRLTLGHSTLLAHDMDLLISFYCGALGFQVTNRGPVGENAELAFLSQDPCHHHQIAGETYDLDQSDEEILEFTREKFCNAPEFRPMAQWQQEFEESLR
jgi:hypothetical protein